jgi:hypothetical protein
MSERASGRAAANGRRTPKGDGAANGRRTPKGNAAPSPLELARRAADDLAELLGRSPESIVSLDRSDDGWRVGVEVVETRRIPDTADVLAQYEVTTDAQGGLVGYRRVRRYARGRVGDDG